MPPPNTVSAKDINIVKWKVTERVGNRIICILLAETLIGVDQAEAGAVNQVPGEGRREVYPGAPKICKELRCERMQDLNLRESLAHLSSDLYCFELTHSLICMPGDDHD